MKYFSIEELSETNTGLDNTPNPLQVNNLTVLVEKVLDPLREMYGKPIKVNSGFRSKEVNEEVGGKSTSQHCSGSAADITTGNKEENKKLYNLIKDNLPYDQLIDEKNFTWVHVSYSKSGNRKQLLKL